MGTNCLSSEVSLLLYLFRRSAIEVTIVIIDACPYRHLCTNYLHGVHTVVYHNM
jgi:hypothetical protein